MNGASEVEIRETLLHTSIYVGRSPYNFSSTTYSNMRSVEFRMSSIILIDTVINYPRSTGMESFRVADEAVTKLKEEGLLPK